MLVFLEDMLLFLEDIPPTTPPVLSQDAMKLVIFNYIIKKYKKNLSILTKK